MTYWTSSRRHRPLRPILNKATNLHTAKLDRRLVQRPTLPTVTQNGHLHRDTSDVASNLIRLLRAVTTKKEAGQLSAAGMERWRGQAAKDGEEQEGKRGRGQERPAAADTQGRAGGPDLRHTGGYGHRGLVPGLAGVAIPPEWRAGHRQGL